MMTFPRLASLAAILCVLVTARGQAVESRTDFPSPPGGAVQPAGAGGIVADDPRWSRAVHTLARTLDGSLPASALPTVTWPYASILPFGRNRAESFRVLPERLGTSMRVVSVRAHTMPAVSAASDLIADLEASDAIAPAILSRLVPASTPDVPAEYRTAALRRADQTMARWLASALDATSPGTAVGVIALYDDGTRAGIAAVPATPQLWFVLVRGHADATDTVGIARILYGPMDAAVR